MKNQEFSRRSFLKNIGLGTAPPMFRSIRGHGIRSTSRRHLSTPTSAGMKSAAAAAVLLPVSLNCWLKNTAIPTT